MVIGIYNINEMYKLEIVPMCNLVRMERHLMVKNQVCPCLAQMSHLQKMPIFRMVHIEIKLVCKIFVSVIIFKTCFHNVHEFIVQ